MTEVVISEAAKAKAKQLLNVNGERMSDSVAHFIQQVSDAAKATSAHYGEPTHMAPFILPEPVDPLFEALADCGVHDVADELRENLAKRGLEIVERKP